MTFTYNIKKKNTLLYVYLPAYNISACCRCSHSVHAFDPRDKIKTLRSCATLNTHTRRVLLRTKTFFKCVHRLLRFYMREPY